MARTRRAIYRAYLRSKKWHRLRIKVIARARGTCERCGLRPVEHVHHLTYERIFKERLVDLQAVCGECHRSLHDLPRKG